MRRKIIKRAKAGSFLLLLLGMLFIFGCGGGGDGGDPSIDDPGTPVEAKTGVFLDSAVAGLTYHTPTRSGITDGAGSFEYLPGEAVTFAIGEVVIGTASGKAILTPIDLVDGASDADHPKVNRICRFLQALDEDADLRNGIEINAETSNIVSQWGIDLDKTEDPDSSETVQGMFAALHSAGVFPKVRDLPRAESARNHMNLTLETVVHAIDVSGKPNRFRSELNDGLEESDGGYGDAPDDVAAPGPPDPESDEEAKREIAEADIIEIHGTDLYLLNPYRGLIICDIANPDMPRISGRLPIVGDPDEMYIQEGRAYIIAKLYEAPLYDIGVPETVAGDEMAIMPRPGESLSRIYLVDVADTAHPALAGSFDLPGAVIDTRIVGDILYAIYSDYNFYGPMPEIDSPDDSVGSGNPDVAWENRVYVAAFNIADPADVREVDQKTFEGTGNFIHVTDAAIFVAGTEWAGDGEKTRITYLDISDSAGAILPRGSLQVAGSVADEFKMNFYDGYLRVCTHEWKENGISHLYVIDTQNPDAMTPVGHIVLGQGEQLFATRFDETRAYLVTYEQKDPLWVVDLSDPANPAIKGELIVPGWSTHIEPMGDRLVALGVDDTEGWRVAVSLFDVSDPEAPGLVRRVSFGEADGWSYSAAHGDVKAFTLLPEMGLILLPYTTSEISDAGYAEENRLQLIDYSRADLTTRGSVTQKGSIVRSRSFQNRLFSVSADELQVIDASDRDNLKVTARKTLAQNYEDFLPLANGYGVRAILERDTFRVQTVSLSDPEGPALGEILLEDPILTGLFENGNTVYVASESGYGYLYRTEDGSMMPEKMPGVRVQAYDFTDPANPRKRGEIEMEGSTGYGPAPIADNMPLYPYYPEMKILQVKDDLLVFTESGQFYGFPEDEKEPDLVLTPVDFSDPDRPQKMEGLQIRARQAVSVFARDGRVYFTYTGEPEPGEDGALLTPYFLGRADFFDPANPLLMVPVNIPGICVGMEGFGPYIYTMENRYENDGSSETIFHALKLEEDAAYLLDSVTLKDHYSGEFLIQERRAWISGGGYTTYEDGSDRPRITLIDLSDPLDLKRYDHPIDAGWWYSIIGAKSGIGFINSSGGTGCYDASDPANLARIDFLPHQSWPNRIAFDQNSAYVPLGFYGIWKKNLP